LGVVPIPYQVFGQRVDTILSDPKAAELANRMIQHYYDTRTAAKRYDPEGVKKQMSIILQFLSFEQLPHHRPAPPWEWEDTRWVAWAMHIAFQDPEDPLDPGSQRMYQGTIRTFVRLIMRSEVLQTQAYHGFGRKVQEFIHEDNSIVHLTDDNTHKTWPDMSREDIDIFFKSIEERCTEAQQFRQWGEAYELARDYAMFYTTYVLGLRRDEVRRLDVDSFRIECDPEKDGEIGEAVVFGKRKKGTVKKKRRTVQLTYEPLVHVLTQYMENVLPWFYLKKTVAPDETALFLSIQGKRIGYDTILKRFHKNIDAALLTKKEYVPHSLRHSYVTQEQERGFPAKFVGQQAGQEFESTVLRYTHFKKEFFKAKMLEITGKVWSKGK